MRNLHYAIASLMPLTVAGRRLTSRHSIVRSDWFDSNRTELLTLLRAGKIKVHAVDGSLRPARHALTLDALDIPAAEPVVTMAAVETPVTAHEVFVQAVTDLMTADLSEFRPVEDPPAAATEAEVEPDAAEEPVIHGGIANIVGISRLEVYPSVASDTPGPAAEPAVPGRVYPQHSDDELLTWKTSELRKLCEDHGVELKSYDTTKTRIIEKWRAAVGGSL